jgi:hypothetical protein
MRSGRAHPAIKRQQSTPAFRAARLPSASRQGVRCLRGPRAHAAQLPCHSQASDTAPCSAHTPSETPHPGDARKRSACPGTANAWPLGEVPCRRAPRPRTRTSAAAFVLLVSYEAPTCYRAVQLIHFPLPSSLQHLHRPVCLACMPGGGKCDYREPNWLTHCCSLKCQNTPAKHDSMQAICILPFCCNM